MDMTRRDFVFTIAIAAGGLQGLSPNAVVHAAEPEPSEPTPPPPPPPEPRQIVDAGPVEKFPTEGVYSFRDDGFFVVRREQKLWAVSAVCTHRGCLVRAQPDRSFYCRCHRSAFDPDGRVVSGPAPADLPRLAVTLDERNHVLVNRGRTFDP
jgi:Rieske Fe-S protein